MRRFTNLFKSLTASDDDKVKTPSFIKPDHSVSTPILPPKLAPKSESISPVKTAAPAPTPKVNEPGVANLNQQTQTNNLSDAVRKDTIDVPVYENDSEWDVVQRSIGLFADNAHLGAEAKQLFVKKWVTELAKAEQTKLYRSDEESNNAHLGNEINRSAADSLTGLLGTYQAMIDPGRQAQMMDELRALRCIEEFDLGLINVYLSRDVKTDLINTVIGTIEEQKTSAQKLIQRSAKGQPEAERIYLSTKDLANRREMRLNAAIKTAVLKMDMAKYQQLGLQTVNSNEPDSLQSATTRKSETRKEAVKETAQPKVSESTWVDEQALKLLGNIRR